MPTGRTTVNVLYVLKLRCSELGNPSILQFLCRQTIPLFCPRLRSEPILGFCVSDPESFRLFFDHFRPFGESINHLRWHISQIPVLAMFLDAIAKCVNRTGKTGVKCRFEVIGVAFDRTELTSLPALLGQIETSVHDRAMAVQMRVRHGVSSRRASSEMNKFAVDPVTSEPISIRLAPGANPDLHGLLHFIHGGTHGVEKRALNPLVASQGMHDRQPLWSVKIKIITDPAV